VVVGLEVTSGEAVGNGVSAEAVGVGVSENAVAVGVWVLSGEDVGVGSWASAAPPMTAA